MTNTPELEDVAVAPGRVLLQQFDGDEEFAMSVHKTGSHVRLDIGLTPQQREDSEYEIGILPEDARIHYNVITLVFTEAQALEISKRLRDGHKFAGEIRAENKEDDGE